MIKLLNCARYSSVLWFCVWIYFWWIGFVFLFFLSVFWFLGHLVAYILGEGVFACITILSYSTISKSLLHPMSSSSDHTIKPDGNSVSHNSVSDPHCPSKLAPSGLMDRGTPSNPHN